MARIEKSIIDSAVASAAAGFVIAGVGITILVHGFVFGMVGIAWGTGIVAASVISLYYPNRHFLLGSLIILLSIASDGCGEQGKPSDQLQAIEIHQQHAEDRSNQ